MKKLILLIAMGICVMQALTAQQQKSWAIKPLVDIMQQLKALYTDNPNLSFHVLYTFADESTPGKIEDSIPAFMQVSNNRCHMTIGPTQTIANGRYAIMLFQEDKIMYITKPSSATADIDPISKIDSALLSLKGIETSVKYQKNIQVITISFPPESGYKSISLMIDTKTGYLVSSQFIIKDEALTNSQFAGAENLTANNGYAIIKANYYNYNKDTIDDSVFSEAKYFTRDNKAFNTTEEFKDYKIFVGSPNL